MSKEAPITYIAPDSQRVVYSRKAMEEINRRKRVYDAHKKMLEDQESLFQKPQLPKPNQLGFNI